jgi:protein-disulfide isomerase
MSRIFPQTETGRLLWAFGLFLLVACTLLLTVRAATNSRAENDHNKTDKDWALIARGISADEPHIGSTTAPVQVIVYSSIACPTCRLFFTEQVGQLQIDFGDAVVFAYRHNPIPQLPSAQIQEPAAECVYQLGGNDAFWAFVRSLFPVAREARAVDPTYLGALASEAGVLPKDFSACLAESNGAAAVARDRQEAAIAGMSVDPSFLLKSAHRAVVIYGDRYSQIHATIRYLLDTEARTAP